MPNYLVIYNRREGRIVRHHDYGRPKIALDARFAAEREFSGQPDIEIVVLGELGIPGPYAFSLLQGRPGTGSSRPDESGTATRLTLTTDPLSPLLTHKLRARSSPACSASTSTGHRDVLRTHSILQAPRSAGLQEAAVCWTLRPTPANAPAAPRRRER